MKCPTMVIAVPLNNEKNVSCCVQFLCMLFNIYHAYIITVWYKHFLNVYVNIFLFYLNNIFNNKLDFVKKNVFKIQNKYCY